MLPSKIDLKQWKTEADRELHDNILPFWMNHTVDRENGGFYGSLTNDLVLDNTVGRSAILVTRILWTFSAAYLNKPDPVYLQMADYTYDYIQRVLVDPLYGGLYWMVDAAGKALMDRKHSYAQAFAIYALSEYYRASGKREALELAKNLFDLLEKHAYEPKGGGHLEGRARDWGELADMRLSDREPDCRKSMNTLLHMLEGYTNLYRVWPEERLRERLAQLVNIFLQHVIDPQTYHLRLFFNDLWMASGTLVSYGHDIEASWLLLEAAEVLADADLIKQVKLVSIKISQAVYDEGLWPDGSIVYEVDRPAGYVNKERHWWPAAEGMVGFYTAYRLSGKDHYLAAARRCWLFALEQLSDRQYGDWRKVLDENYQVKPGTYKMGPWECPYHHARACLEMIKHLG